MGETIKILCPRCGSEMNIKARCCLKCGYLNPEHPDNKDMNKYSEVGLGTYSVGSGKKIGRQKNDNNVVLTTVSNNTGNKRLCFWINIIAYLIFVVAIISYIFLNTGNLMGVIRSKLYIYLLIASAWIFVFYSIELVYMKMNKKWWSALIPIYNMMVLSDAVLKSSLLGLIVFIPVIGQIFLLYIIFKLGLAFKKSGFLTVLFPFIMFPVIGFGSSSFEGRSYVDEEENAIEKDYKRSKNFLIVVFLIFMISTGLFAFNNLNLFKTGYSNLSREYYVSIAKKMVKDTKWNIKHNRINCDKYSTSNEYVFYFPDVGDQFNIPFSLYNEVVEGYVIAIKDNEGNYTYKVSLTDGDRGIPEINEDNIKVESVTKFTKLDKKYEYGLSCSIK